jgi:hypothetical protein
MTFVAVGEDIIQFENGPLSTQFGSLSLMP